MFDAALHGALIVLKPVLFVVGFVVFCKFVSLLVKMRRG